MKVTLDSVASEYVNKLIIRMKELNPNVGTQYSKLASVLIKNAYKRINETDLKSLSENVLSLKVQRKNKLKRLEKFIDLLDEAALKRLEIAAKKSAEMNEK